MKCFWSTEAPLVKGDQHVNRLDYEFDVGVPRARPRYCTAIWRRCVGGTDGEERLRRTSLLADAMGAGFQVMLSILTAFQRCKKTLIPCDYPDFLP